jgi:isopentenyldiphosphate isomerase
MLLEACMEYFEVFADNGACLGLVPRAEVHRRGLWHRSAHCFVWNSRGEMLLQRRAPDKDLYAGSWDYAAGEHLKHGESYLRGMQRGLLEELGLANIWPVADGPLCREALQWPGGIDAEIQQAFVLITDQPIQVDGVEVVAVRWVDRNTLLGWIDAAPDAFTPWFLREMRRLSIASRWDQLVKALS